MQALEAAPLVRLQGKDAVAFAQAQFSGDVASLREAHWQWNAWLDAQGRVRYFFALLRIAEEHLLAWLPFADTHAMCTELRRYVFRARLEIEAVSGWALHGAARDVSPTAEQVVAYAGGHALRLPGSSARVAVLAPQGTRRYDAAALDGWHREDIQSGLPWIAPALASEFVAQSAGLQRLGAISLDKGCYPGQEIVARLHYRGGNKRQLCRVQTSSPNPPVPGSRILERDSSRPVGHVLYSTSHPDSGSLSLAILPNDHDSEQLELADGVAIAACMPFDARTDPA